MNKIKTSRKLIVLAAVMAAVVGATFLSGALLRAAGDPWLKLAMQALDYGIMAAAALIGMKLTGLEIKPLFNFKGGKQYLIALLIALPLSLGIAVIPALCGGSLVGGRVEPNALMFLRQGISYLLIVGPVEELVFRAFAQELLAGLLPKREWLAVIIASALFGLWHIINGNFVQVMFTFGIGAVFGFARQYLKGCTFISVALGHGIYDYLNIFVRAFIVRV